MEYKVGQKVSVVIGEQTALGFIAHLADGGEGLLYKSEMYRKVMDGQTLEAWVKKIREDGKLDLSLQPIGFRKTNEKNIDRILSELKQRGGFLPLHDKSDPVEIKMTLEMSKKAFKSAVGVLYRKRLVTLDQNGIRLNKKTRN
jgi:predicted RNA-binding protein (virulence factor B family)